MQGDLVMNRLSLVIFGGGNMGAALARGLAANKFVAPGDLAIVEKSPERRVILQKDFPEEWEDSLEQFCLPVCV